jgi:hypothetical protein
MAVVNDYCDDDKSAMLFVLCCLCCALNAKRNFNVNSSALTSPPMGKWQCVTHLCVSQSTSEETSQLIPTTPVSAELHILAGLMEIDGKSIALRQKLLICDVAKKTQQHFGFS